MGQQFRAAVSAAWFHAIGAIADRFELMPGVFARLDLVAETGEKPVIDMVQGNVFLPVFLRDFAELHIDDLASGERSSGIERMLLAIAGSAASLVAEFAAIGPIDLHPGVAQHRNNRLILQLRRVAVGDGHIDPIHAGDADGKFFLRIHPEMKIIPDLLAA